MQGITENDLIDLTPALKAEALEVVKRYKMGPFFTPPVVSSLDGPLGDAAGAVGCRRRELAGRVDGSREQLPLHPLAHGRVSSTGSCRPIPRSPTWGTSRGQARAAAPGPVRRRWGAAGGRAGAGRGGATVQGLPLIKPPYDRITAYNMNTGDIVWQKPHSSTPDDIKNHPALKGVNLPRLGQPGRTFIGVLTTKTLIIAGEGGVHTNEAGKRVALLRAYDKRTGADAGAVEMPAKQTGSPMTYQIDGKQFIVLAVSGNDGAELLAYALP